MDAVRKLILERLTDLGLTMKEASIRIGRSHAYLQQFLKRGVPAELGEHERAQLAHLLGVPEDSLRGSSPRLPAKEYARLSSRVPRSELTNVKFATPGGIRVDNNTETPSHLGNRDLPVFGTAQGGQEGALIMSGEAVDWVARPDPLLRVKDGYGMIVSGESMSPKVESGETVLVNPHIPPHSGDVCVFRRHDDDGTVYALIKKLRRSTDDTWHVEQFHPKKQFTLKRSVWQVCHVVIGAYYSR